MNIQNEIETILKKATISLSLPEVAEVVGTQLALLHTPSEAEQDLLDTPFHLWERASFTIPPCNYCHCRDCQC